MKAVISTAADQLKRLLTLIPRLADGEEHPVADVATIVGVSPDQVIDDLRALVERFDTPGGFVDGVQIYQEGDSVSVVTPHFLRPMRLTMAELCSIELGLAILRSERTGVELAPIERALARLRNVITRVPGDERLENILAGAAPAAHSARHLSVLRLAVRSRRKARLSYRKGATANAESRVICPYCLVFTSGMWYAVAHCERANALRVFRMDRVAEVSLESEAYAVPDDFSVDGVLEQSKAYLTSVEGETLRVRYSPRIARWIAEREGAPLDADGGLTLQHPLSDDAWAVRHVLQYGADAEVLSPSRIRDSIRHHLETA
jgi:proteasome accessory factor C